MATSDLRQFMVERLLALDPTLSDEVGSRMYSVVIDPLIVRLGADPLATDVESFIIDRVAEEYPELDLTSPSSALRDTLLKPLILLLEPVRREIEFLRTQRGVDDAAALTETEMDALLSNIFSYRRTGAFARGRVRMYFNAPRSLTLDNSALFSTSTGVGYVPDEIRTYAVTEFKRAGGQYYIEVPIRSREPVAEANVDKNSITSVINVDGVVRVTNPLPIVYGVSRETNEDFLQRAERSLTERSMNTQRGIEAALLDVFPDIVSVQVVGFGEAEMERDILRAVVTVDQEEAIGSMVYATADFRTVATLGSASKVGLSHWIKLESPTAEVVALVQAASYLRVVDGNGYFQPGLLSRVRRIEELDDTSSPGDLFIRTSDFETFPASSPLLPVNSVLLSTNGDEYGFNQHPSQGANGALVVTDGVNRMVRGAPLPFTDTVQISGAAGTDHPYTAEFGRDFLIVQSSSSYFLPAPDGLVAAPTTLRAYPVLEKVSSNVVRVGRLDSFCTSAKRIGVAPASYTYQPDSTYLAAQETPRVIDYGVPAFDAATRAERWDGVTVAGWATNPGVSFQLTDQLDGDPLGYTAANIGTTEMGMLVTLEATQRSWASRGVKAGHFISLAVFRDDNAAAVFDGDVTGVGGANGLKWHATGRIVEVVDDVTLLVNGADPYPLEQLASADLKGGFVTGTGTFAAGTYPVAWTVYEGVREVIPAGGSLSTSSRKSFDELVFPGAYKLGRYNSTNGAVSVPGAGRYNAAGAYSTTFGTGGFSSTTGATTQLAWSSVVAHWVRLDKSVLDEHTTVGMDVPVATQAALPVLLAAGEDYTNDLGPATALSESYLRSKYNETETFDQDATAAQSASADVVVWASLPVVEGSKCLTLSAAAPVDDNEQLIGTVLNDKGHSGFLLPYPLGSLQLTDLPGVWGTYNSSPNNLYNQVVEFYAAAEDERDLDTTLTLSGLAGGVPFPTQFGDTVVVENDAVHVGGMTDVYVKQASEDADTTGTIVMWPRDLLDTAELVFEGTDGAIDVAAPSDLLSASFTLWLEDNYDTVAGTKYLDNLVLEVVIPPSDSVTAHSRILCNIAGGVRVEGNLITAAAYANVHFRVLATATVNLASPIRVYQQGVNGSAVSGGLTVTLPSGVMSYLVTSDPVILGLKLYVDTGTNRGVYDVLSVAANSVTLSSAMRATDTSLPFKLGAAQGASTSLPLVRVRAVSLSGDDVGTVIPYRHPVDAAASNFYGMNNDPLTDDTVGATGVLTGNTTTIAKFTVAGYDWDTNGIVENDVLKLDGVSEELTYWYITNVDSGTGELTLDRVTSTSVNLSDVGFTVGKAAVGEVTLRFLDRTFIEIGPDTVFQYTDANDQVRKFRPSPSEESTLYRALQFTSEFTSVSADLGAAIVFDGNLFTHEVEDTDVVRVLTEVLVSDVHAPATVDVGGKTLVLTIDDRAYSIKFSGSGSRTLQQAVADINRVVGQRVRAAVSATDQITLASRQHVQLVDTGSSGILAELGFSTPTQLDNKSDLNLFAEFEIQSFTYDEGANKTTVTFVPPAVTRTGASDIQLFVDVVREKYQRVYPADMTAGAFGLYESSLRLTSYDPFDGTSATEGVQFEVSGYRSLGYSVTPENDVFSYSTAEVPLMTVTSVMLVDTATSMQDAVVLPGATVVVDYEYSSRAAAAQEYMLLKSVRVQCHNPLVRYAFPAFPAMRVVFTGSATVDEVTTRVNEYVSSLYPNKPLQVYDLLTQFQGLNVDRVELPQEAGFIQHYKDRTIRVVRDEDVVVLPKQAHIVGGSPYLIIERG